MSCRVGGSASERPPPFFFYSFFFLYNIFHSLVNISLVSCWESGVHVNSVALQRKIPKFILPFVYSIWTDVITLYSLIMSKKKKKLCVDHLFTSPTDKITTRGRTALTAKNNNSYECIKPKPMKSKNVKTNNTIKRHQSPPKC